MTNLFLWLIATSMVISSVIDFAKPAYKKFAGKFAVSINILLSFILWEIASFSIAPLLGLELNAGMLILLGLALWTGSNIWYDLLKLVKALGEKLSEGVKALKE